MNPLPSCHPEDSAIRVRSAAAWAEHFRANVRRDWAIAWHADAPLPGDVRRIAASIAEFQRGESSEAVHYLAKSQRFSRDVGDPAFHDASILFVREENAHAALLLRFMRQAGIPPRQAAFTDSVFRWLRAFSDLGWSSRVLIIAELIAQEYYPCLRAATPHPALIRICDKIICDEEEHIRFQVERIARLESTRGSPVVRAREALQTVLMAGTAAVVYLGHWRVLTTRLGFFQFVRRVLARNARAIRAIRRLRAGVQPDRLFAGNAPAAAGGD
jgi:hypothetical protein